MGGAALTNLTLNQIIQEAFNTKTKKGAKDQHYYWNGLRIIMGKKAFHRKKQL